MPAYTWRGTFASNEVESLHALGFNRPASFEWDWWQQVTRHSLGWVCAREDDALVGWVNVAWEGGVHAFLLDVVVHPSHRRRGIGRQLVAQAELRARNAGCEWLHVDFGEDLRGFYLTECGFSPTGAGLIALV